MSKDGIKTGGMQNGTFVVDNYIKLLRFMHTYYKSPYHKAKYTINEIVKLTGIPRATCGRIVKKFLEFGILMRAGRRLINCRQNKNAHKNHALHAVYEFVYEFNPIWYMCKDNTGWR